MVEIDVVRVVDLFGEKEPDLQNDQNRDYQIHNYRYLKKERREVRVRNQAEESRMDFWGHTCSSSRRGLLVVLFELEESVELFGRLGY